MATLLAPAVSAAKELWECHDSAGDWDNPLVVAANDIDTRKGMIVVAGTSHDTVYYVAGFNRRWDWGSYFFIIEPNGEGAYYDSSTQVPGGATRPSLEFRCRQTTIEKLWPSPAQGRPGE